MRAGNHMVLSCLTLYPVRPRIGAAWTRLCCGWTGRWTGGAIHMQVRSVAALIRKIQIAVGQRAKSGIKRGWRGGRIRTFPNVRNRRIYRSFQRDAQSSASVSCTASTAAGRAKWFRCGERLRRKRISAAHWSSCTCSTPPSRTGFPPRSRKPGRSIRSDPKRKEEMEHDRQGIPAFKLERANGDYI